MNNNQIRWHHYLGLLSTFLLAGWAFERIDGGISDRLIPALSKYDLIFVVVFISVGFWAFHTAYDFIRYRAHEAAHATAITGILFAATFLGLALFLAKEIGAAITMLGIGLATIGWLTQANASRIANRKQHTLNILMEMRQCEVVIKCLREINKELPTGTSLSKQQALDLEKEYRTGSEHRYYSPPFSWSLAYLLNYYEFLSAGVIHGDIDNKFLSDTHGSAISGLYKRAYSFICLQWALEILEKESKEFTAENLPEISGINLSNTPPNDKSAYFMLYSLVEENWDIHPEINDEKDASAP